MPEDYGEDYFRSVYGAGDLRRLRPAWFSARFYAAVTRRLLRERRGARLLEIGCGQGFVLGFLEKEFELTGIDISDYALRCARARLPGAELLRADLEQGPPSALAGRRFDVVLARYVLEHLHRPESVVRRVFEVLEAGGLFFFSVPNTRSLGSRVKGGSWYARRDPTHVSLLSPEQWLRLVGEAGFEVVRESADGCWDLPYIKGVPTWLQALYFLAPTVVMCLRGRLTLPARCGENLLIVARRPPAPLPEPGAAVGRQGSFPSLESAGKLPESSEI